jgi:serine phosphatase RsbU (regulator of sigma subunit)
MMPRHSSLFAVLTLLGIATAQGAELFVNRVIRPDAAEITWIGDAVLTAGFVVATWLWVRLRDAQIALSDLERQQIVTETQLTIAARVQTSLLPAIPKPMAGISWCATVEPAFKVGGDYYDFLPLPDGRMCVVLGDVSGKGIAAAVFLANVRATLRALAREASNPRTLVANLSSTLFADSTSGFYVTCIVAFVDPNDHSMVYVNAGHPAGVLWNPRGGRGLRVGGPPAGLLHDARFEEERLSFGAGDLVVFVSDGVTEALDASGDGVVDVVSAQIALARKATPQGACASLLAAARNGPGPHGVDDWMDDRTAVAFGVVAGPNGFEERK